MNPYRSRTGRFRRPTVREAALLVAAILRARSEPHCRGERTKAARRADARREHLRRWLDAGVVAPRAVRLLGGGNG